MTTIENEMAEIKSAMNELATKEYCVAHNAGTFSSVECVRAIGTGEASRGERYEYETVGGAKRATGPDAEDAPGIMRRSASVAAELANDRAELKRLSRKWWALNKRSA